MLRDEIGESHLRLKCVKFGGQSIDEIMPQYQNSFYLPDREKFKVPKSMHIKSRITEPLNSQQRSIASPTTPSNFRASDGMQTKAINVEESNIEKLQESMFITEHPASESIGSTTLDSSYSSKRPP